MSALLSLIVATLQKVLVGFAGEFLRQARHDRTTRQNAILNAQIRSRKAIDRAKKTTAQRDLSAVRERLRKRAQSR